MWTYILKPSTKKELKRKATAAVDLILNSLAPGQSSKVLRLIQENIVDKPATPGPDLLHVITKLYDTYLRKAPHPHREINDDDLLSAISMIDASEAISDVINEV